MTESCGTAARSHDESDPPSSGMSPERWRAFDSSRDRKGAALQAAVGREIRSLRLGFGMNLQELAAEAGISASTLCRVEKGSISPSLDTLQALSSAFQVPLARLFRGFEKGNRVRLMKAGDGIEIGHGDTGFQRRLFRHVGSDGMAVELGLLTASTLPERLPTFRREGLELLYLLEGEITYRHGNALYRMAPGDCLFLDTGEPHGPHELAKLPMRLLSMVCYRAA
ncbi:helix-turn-helix domain-containing protein [Mesorhizobium sp. KR2-14]|uniref:helix-turn-helix domain-containing protein n=1 Tax=Mesorhizobium sp. KR2-14 TaxID=3156610 RepID=UPI0032B5B6B0